MTSTFLRSYTDVAIVYKNALKQVLKDVRLQILLFSILVVFVRLITYDNSVKELKQ